LLAAPSLLQAGGLLPALLLLHLLVLLRLRLPPLPLLPLLLLLALWARRGAGWWPLAGRAAAAAGAGRTTAWPSLQHHRSWP
jgi:hypothetical protein